MPDGPRSRARGRRGSRRRSRAIAEQRPCRPRRGDRSAPAKIPAASARPRPWQPATKRSIGEQASARSIAAPRRGGPGRCAGCARLRPMAEQRTRIRRAADGDAAQSRPAPPRAHDGARSRALRGAVRRADAGHALLGDARPDGDHRAARGDLARRRPAGHLDLPARELRRADDADRAGVLGRGAPVRADRGLRRDQGRASAR